MGRDARVFPGPKADVYTSLLLKSLVASSRLLPSLIHAPAVAGMSAHGAAGAALLGEGSYFSWLWSPSVLHKEKSIIVII